MIRQFRLSVSEADYIAKILERERAELLHIVAAQETDQLSDQSMGQIGQLAIIISKLQGEQL